MEGSTRNSAKIVIIEDHPIFRTGLIQLIEAEVDLKVVGEAGTAMDGKSVVLQQKPDLVLVDISLHDSNGIDLIKDLLVEFPNLKILVVSMHDESFYAERAVHAGAKGYVMKQEAPTKIIEAIRILLKGKIYLSEAIKERLLERMIVKPGKETVSSVGDLSDREFGVFDLIGLGFGTSEIASKLNLSVKTIETHKDHLKYKLNLNSSGELRQFAIQWKLTHRL